MKTNFMRKQWLSLWLVAVLFFMLSMTAFASENPEVRVSQENTYHEIPEKTETIADFTKLNFVQEKAIIELHNASSSIGANNEKQILVDKPTDTTEGWTVTDIGTITFPNIGKIGDSSIDVIVTLNSATFGPCIESTDSTESQVQIAMLSTAGDFWIGSYDIEKSGIDNISTCWQGVLSVDVATKVVWSQSQQTVELPFIHVASDIDVYREKIGFREAFETKTGYTGTYYGYAGHTWEQTETGLGLMKFLASTTAGETLGEESYTKAGVYVETAKGEFTSTFHSESCAAMLNVHSQYAANENTNPEKSVAQAEDGSYDVGDTVTYNIKQKMGKFYEDTFCKYDSMSIYDFLPDGLTYKSAKLLEESGNEVGADVGSVNYNSEDKKVSFDFDSAWLQDEANYGGQYYTLQITATIDDSAAGQVIKNKGYTSIGDLIFGSNEVEIKVTPAPITVEIDAIKKLTGAKLANNQFTFELLNENGEVIAEAKNDADGNIKFFVELEEGTYTYKLREVNDKQKDITYDNTEYTITVVVTEGADGVLTAEIEKALADGNKAEEITFNNVYTAPIPKTDEPSDTTPKTGDSANIGLWIALAISSLFIIVVSVFGKKRHFNHNK